MNEKDIVERVSKLSPKEILGYAIASEEGAREFYESLSSKLGELLGDFFRDLARAEESHRKILLTLHEKLFGDTNYSVPEGIPLAERAVEVETVANLIEAMEVALLNEKTAERIYTHLAEALPDHRGILLLLAAQEEAHYASIKSHREYLEGLREGEPDYVEAPVDYINSQLEMYINPRGRL
ncbi:ferritin-like domain-containing protein [Palaeococcus ferrophilus]|uniref:ferritin-like domain-containing protein n=1 Tax=Palaeococcus ferrophilus TaxID=83868 RepID=UPI00064FDA47|nr:ferritin family protein [Palaeococcus ferrophilus]